MKIPTALASHTVYQQTFKSSPNIIRTTSDVTISSSNTRGTLQIPTKKHNISTPTGIVENNQNDIYKIFERSGITQHATNTHPSISATSPYLVNPMNEPISNKYILMNYFPKLVPASTVRATKPASITHTSQLQAPLKIGLKRPFNELFLRTCRTIQSHPIFSTDISETPSTAKRPSMKLSNLILRSKYSSKHKKQRLL